MIERHHDLRHASWGPATFLAAMVGFSLGCAGSSTTGTSPPSTITSSAWKFVVFGDTHVTGKDAKILGEIAAAAQSDGAELVLAAGDNVEGGPGLTQDQMQTQLNAWQTLLEPLTSTGVGVYPVRGNHEADVPTSVDAWNAVFSGTSALPANGPTGETNLTYSFTHKNALFLAMDDYIDNQTHRVNQAWLDEQLAANKQPHVFVYSHEPAFEVFHTDCLGQYPTERNTFWASLKSAGVKVYFSGHDHFFDLARIDDGDGDPSNDMYQCVVGTAGGKLFNDDTYSGDNIPYTPMAMYHVQENGYVLVEISGDGASDLDVTLTWKQRTLDSATGQYQYVTTGQTLTYKAAAK